MNIDRLKKLENFLENDPNDPFLIYALAIEWLGDKPQKAKEYFDVLLQNHPDYIGTYYHAAGLYAEMGLDTEAEEIFKKGMVIAERSGDHHALRELKSAYNEFLFNDEDE